MSFAKAKALLGDSSMSSRKESVLPSSCDRITGRGKVGKPSPLRGSVRRAKAIQRMKKEKPNDKSEAWLHRHTKNLLDLSAGPGVLYLHTGNGLQRSGKVMNMLKNMGVRTGALDWLIIVEGRAHWLELKAPNKEPSDEQLAFMDEARAAGCPAYVADDPMEVRTILWAWNAINVLPDTVSA